MTEPRSRWWRFSAYELREERLQPADAATPSEYDPWGDYLAARAGRAHLEAPYESLLELVHELRFAPKSATELRALTDESRTLLLEWCSRHGLLGVAALSTQSQLRASEGHAMFRSSVGQGGRLDAGAVSELWRLYLSDESAIETEAGLAMASLYQRYAEPIDDFLRAAMRLVDTLARVGAKLEEAGESRSPELGLEILNEFEPLALTAGLGDSSDLSPPYREAAEMPSLITLFAQMALQDIAGVGMRPVRCAVCGRTFVTQAYQAQYCSARCRNTAQRRSQRERARSAPDA